MPIKYWKYLLLNTKMAKYAGRRRKTTYTPKRYGRKAATAKKPYGGSRYGNDAFVKVEYINNLATNPPTGSPPLGGEVFSTMRVDRETGTDGNTYLYS
ncbi:MAG: hypothetical protein [Circular genetic element sp.]|nr:MAG: hypothetical protein [Circular genetic element sp.]